MKRATWMIVGAMAVVAWGCETGLLAATFFNRSAGWSTTGMVHGTSTNNPVNGMWRYEYVGTGDGLTGADPWWNNAGAAMVWDSSWYGGGGLWAKGDNSSPPIDSARLTHNNSSNYNDKPRAGWISPSAGFVNVSGTLSTNWLAGASADLDIAIAKRSAGGSYQHLWSGTAKTAGPTSFNLTAEPGLKNVPVNPGDSIVWTTRAAAASGGWTDLIDNAMNLALGNPGGKLLGYWTFDDPANVGRDSSGRNIQATVTGATQNANVPGPIGAGSSLSFNGSSNTASMPGMTGPMDPFTVAFWINPASRTNYNQVIGTPNWNQFNFHTTAAGELYVGVDAGSGSSRFTPGQLPANTLELGNWQHFAFTFDKGEASLYKNGVRLAYKTGMNLPQNWTGFSFGTSVNGLVDDVAIWGGAQGPKTVNALAKGFIAPDDGYARTVLNDSPVAYWRLDDAPGSTTARDIAGTNNGAYSGAVNLGGIRPFLDGRPNAFADFAGGSMSASSVTGLRDNFSVEFWLNPDTLVNYNQVLGATGSWGQFLFHSTASGAVYVGQGGADGTQRMSPADLPAGTISLDQWQHFVYTFQDIDATWGLAKFYKNGQLLAQRNLQKGSAWTGFNLYGGLDGLLDEVALYDYALGPDQILAHYQAAVPEPAALALALLGLLGLAIRRGIAYNRKIGPDVPA